MIGFEYFTAGYDNPVGLFGWLYVLESMGDDLGSQVSAAIDQALGLDGKALRFLAGHGINDVAHTAAGLHRHRHRFNRENRGHAREFRLKGGQRLNFSGRPVRVAIFGLNFGQGSFG